MTPPEAEVAKYTFTSQTGTLSHILYPPVSAASIYRAELTAFLEVDRLASTTAQTRSPTVFLSNKQVYHTKSAVTQRAARKRHNANSVHALRKKQKAVVVH